MISVAIVGFGYWGKNLTRNFFHSDDCKLVAVIEPDLRRVAEVKKLYPGVLVYSDLALCFAESEIDAVAIATPVFTHYQLASVALKAGKHVLVEKPMASTVKQAKDLLELSRKHHAVLMTDHTFLYTGAVREMKQLMERNEIGKIMYYDSTRINLGLFQPDVNVVWDLAPHDLSILFYLTDERPLSVSATGISHLNNKLENIAYVTLHFQSNLIAHFTCSWSSPVKIRKILVGGDRRMILYDDMEITEKVKVYDSGFSPVIQDENERQEMRVDYRAGDIHIPKLNSKEALVGVVEDFLGAINDGRDPVSNSQSGLDVVKVLEAAQVSIRQNGREVKIN